MLLLLLAGNGSKMLFLMSICKYLCQNWVMQMFGCLYFTQKYHPLGGLSDEMKTLPEHIFQACKNVSMGAQSHLR